MNVSDFYNSTIRILGLISPKTILLCVLFIAEYNGHAQLSPGHLSQAHSKLEGLSNCTQCHTIGDKVSNSKCLLCHKEINRQIIQSNGFHAASQTKKLDCFSCHSEHHGLNFQMIRIDKKTFNHSLTGYELKGAHKTKIKNCQECHQAANIQNPSLKKKPNSYLGLDSKCLSCHDDYHQKTLSSECSSCHDLNSFRPASGFNHNNSDFELNGAHKKTDCASCHKVEIRNGKRMAQYTNLNFSSCASCHKDEHKGEFGTNCKACHLEESFKKIVPSKSFNHGVTGYQLEGKHKEITCKKCHDTNHGLTGSFTEFKTKKNIDCNTCHRDIHEGKLGKDCKSCHNQQSFLLKSKSFSGKFDHDKTNYPLQGKHQMVDCRSCHKSDLTDPLPHNTCMSCHQDKHHGEFEKKKSVYPDCATCHSVDAFSPSNFTIKDHEKSRFKLDGAHVAQPCFACHQVNKNWIFSFPTVECISCHKDIHQGFIDQRFYGDKSCVSCHQTSSWQDVRFNHKNTDFSLEGKHVSVSCGACHMNKKSTNGIQKFKGLSSKCVTCHEDIHGGQFVKNGQNNCIQCHGLNAWDTQSFNHDNTNYRLDGEHKLVDCAKCHKYTLPANRRIRLFKIEKHECIDCHL